MKRAVSVAIVLVTISLMVPAVLHRVHAQEAPAAAALTPEQVIAQIMDQIGQGRIDDAVGMMDGLKNQVELRQAARSRLIGLRDDQGQYTGYDIAAVQRFSGRFETLDVLAYYNDQPVLFRFHFYKPQTANGGKWMILGFQISTAVSEIVDILKDTPVDYIGKK